MTNDWLDVLFFFRINTGVNFVIFLINCSAIDFVCLSLLIVLFSPLLKREIYLHEDKKVWCCEGSDFRAFKIVCYGNVRGMLRALTNMYSPP